MITQAKAALQPTIVEVPKGPLLSFRLPSQRNEMLFQIHSTKHVMELNDSVCCSLTIDQTLVVSRATVAQNPPRCGDEINRGWEMGNGVEEQ
jgi:hypothetical protein